MTMALFLWLKSFECTWKADLFGIYILYERIVVAPRRQHTMDSMEMLNRQTGRQAVNLSSLNRAECEYALAAFFCTRKFRRMQSRDDRRLSITLCECVRVPRRYWHDTRISCTPIKSTPHKFTTNQKWAKPFGSWVWVRAPSLPTRLCLVLHSIQMANTIGAYNIISMLLSVCLGQSFVFDSVFLLHPGRWLFDCIHSF